MITPSYERTQGNVVAGLVPASGPQGPDERDQASSPDLEPVESYGVNSFQCPSETTSTAPSTTLIAV